MYMYERIMYFTAQVVFYQLITCLYYIMVVYYVWTCILVYSIA